MTLNRGSTRSHETSLSKFWAGIVALALAVPLLGPTVAEAQAPACMNVFGEIRVDGRAPWTLRRNETSLEEQRQALTIDAQFAPQDANLIKGLARRIARFTGRLDLPDVYIAKEEGALAESSFTPGINRIEIHFPVDKNTRIKSIVIFCHEIGHALFDQNVKLPLLNKKQSVPDALKELAERERKLRSSSEFLQGKARLEAEIHDPELLKNQLLKTYNDLGGRKIKLARAKVLVISQILEAHNELMADLTAVMLNRDGQIVSNELGSRSAGRDFTQHVSIEGFTPKGKLQLRYEALDPTRSYLWERYLSALDERTFPLILEAFTRATEIQASQYLQRGLPTRGLFGMNWQTLNRDFITVFDAELAKLTAPPASSSRLSWSAVGRRLLDIFNSCTGAAACDEPQ